MPRIFGPTLHDAYGAQLSDLFRYAMLCMNLLKELKMGKMHENLETL